MDRITGSKAFVDRKQRQEIKEKYGHEAIFSVIGTGRDLWNTVPFITFGASAARTSRFTAVGRVMVPDVTLPIFLGAGYPEIDYASAISGRPFREQSAI
jgi:hypothetical protein